MLPHTAFSFAKPQQNQGLAVQHAAGLSDWRYGNIVDQELDTGNNDFITLFQA